jgi:hypothetical protein
VSVQYVDASRLNGLIFWSSKLVNWNKTETHPTNSTSVPGSAPEQRIKRPKKWYVTAWSILLRSAVWSDNNASRAPDFPHVSPLSATLPRLRTLQLSIGIIVSRQSNSSVLAAKNINSRSRHSCAATRYYRTVRQKRCLVSFSPTDPFWSFCNCD